MDFKILGGLEIWKGERQLEIRDPKQRALLALLLLEPNRVVSTDRIIEGLWGGTPPPTAPTALNGLVSELRGAFEEEADRLVTRQPGYLLRASEDEIDARRFERLLAAGRTALEDGDLGAASRLLGDALALWRGPALGDFPGDDSAQFEAGRLEEARLAAVEDRMDADLALGRHAQLVPELEALVADQPLRERVRGQLMLALYRCGRQADALAAYADARRTLTDALGLEPGPALQGLQRAILRQDAALNVPPSRSETVTMRDRADELKPVTALFADLVGSTPLGERLATAEVKVLIGECVTAMSRAVEEHGGIVQAYQGDGICAYFGVPSAHEDDPERAARAALRIREVIGEYARDIGEAWGIEGFSVRVGINSGQAAVGLVGAAAPQAVALGDATNVAARLEAAAEPGTVLVGEATARRLQHGFVLEPVGSLALKGRSERVAAFKLAGFAHRERSPPSLLVGRDAEVARLRAIGDDLRAGRGQVLLLTGEAGIGKTRLLTELRALVSDEVTWLEGTCASYGRPPAWPFVEMLRGWLGVEEGAAEISVRTKARAKLGALLGDPSGGVLPALGQLLRIRIDPALDEESLGDERGPAVRQAYVAWIEALASRRPVVVALEDVDWADGATRELAEELLGLTERSPVLFAATLAGERSSEGWRLRLRILDQYAHRSVDLPLAPLADDAAAQLLATLLPGALDDSARAELVARAEGNPLYLEELLRALVEGGGVERRHRTWTLTSAASRLLPPALESVLVARLDRLPKDARRVAQIAAAVGRTFPLGVLQRVAGGNVADELSSLLRDGVVRELRRYPEPEYAFRHRLLQEAALSMVPGPRRRELYADVAAAWEEHFAGSLDDHGERLAHYYAQAGERDRAEELLARDPA